MFFSAFCTFSFDDKRHGMGKEPIGQFDMRQMLVFQTERPLARLTIEMNMTVVVVAVATMLAQFIVEHAASVLKGMHHIVFEEKGQHAEDARLVHGGHGLVDVRQAHRPLLGD